MKKPAGVSGFVQWVALTFFSREIHIVVEIDQIVVPDIFWQGIMETHFGMKQKMLPFLKGK